MSAQEGHRYPPVRSHEAAGARHVEQTLRSYGPLTHAGLYRLSGAEHWEPGVFDAAMGHLLRTGRARDLGGVIYVVGEVAGRQG